ncbi:DMT family transporter [Stappia sp.]|uniref:DMT family transporter n=1 Tax=Stappia sp. TaxID=1870903 RepID=UPI003A99BA77
MTTPPLAEHAPDSAGPLAGIALRLAATGLFACMSLCVRLASFEAPVGQIVFWRSAVALVPIVIYLMILGRFPAALATRNPLGHLRRSAFGCAAMFFSFLCLASLPLALATALGFLAPLVAIPFAMIFLKERPAPLVIGAAGLGFAGIGLMLAPAFNGPAPDITTLVGIAAGLACAITTASAKVEIKRLTASEPAGTIAFYFALVCALAGLATAPFGWSDASGTTLLWLAGAGLCGGLAHIAMTEALARAPVSTLAPFEYTAMIWAMGFDLAVFALVPSPLGLAGAAVVVAAAALIAFAPGWRPARTPATQRMTP